MKVTLSHELPSIYYSHLIDLLQEMKIQRAGSGSDGVLDRQAIISYLTKTFGLDSATKNIQRGFSDEYSPAIVQEIALGVGDPYFSDDYKERFPDSDRDADDLRHK